MLTRLAATTILVLILTIKLSPQRRGEPIHNGFYKAQTYLDMSPDAERMYVTGVLDGMYEAPAFGALASNPLLLRIESCVEGMKGSQVAAIVLKYIKEHPEQWHWDLKDNVYNAMLEACPVP